MRTDAKVGDDGSWCIHLGTYPGSNKTVWCKTAGDPTATLQPIPGGVRFNHSTRVSITTCGFRHMGGAGLDVAGGSQHVRVAGCLFADVGGSAIQVGGTNPCPQGPGPGYVCPETITPDIDYNVTITDTAVVNATQEFGGCLGVWAGYMRQFRFVHNDVCRLQYGGVSVGWGWAIDVAKTYQRDNEIGHNRISHYLKSFQDSGGTYTLGPHPNSSNHHNWVSHAGSGIEPGADGECGVRGWSCEDGMVLAGNLSCLFSGATFLSSLDFPSLPLLSLVRASARGSLGFPLASICLGLSRFSVSRILSPWLHVLRCQLARFKRDFCSVRIVHVGTPSGGPHGGGYYPDDGSAFWRIHDNVASNINFWLFAWNPADQYGNSNIIFGPFLTYWIFQLYTTRIRCAMYPAYCPYVLDAGWCLRSDVDQFVFSYFFLQVQPHRGGQLRRQPALRDEC